mgnify:CR=1 FL=1
MTLRERFDQELRELRGKVIDMAQLVYDQLVLALQGMETLDTDVTERVFAMDEKVNETRFAIEAMCFRLIATQQPTARDLRFVIAAMNIIIDLERMGDKAKDIAETLAQLERAPKRAHIPELERMSKLVKLMLQNCIQAYANDDVALAAQVAERDAELDALFADVLNQTIEQVAKSPKEKKITASFGVMRAAQNLERVGDLATNVAERIIYTVTGTIQEMNIHTFKPAD